MGSFLLSMSEECVELRRRHPNGQLGEPTKICRSAGPQYDLRNENIGPRFAPEPAQSAEAWSGPHAGVIKCWPRGDARTPALLDAGGASSSTLPPRGTTAHAARHWPVDGGATAGQRRRGAASSSESAVVAQTSEPIPDGDGVAFPAHHTSRRRSGSILASRELAECSNAHAILEPQEQRGRRLGARCQSGGKIVFGLALQPESARWLVPQHRGARAAMKDTGTSTWPAPVRVRTSARGGSWVVGEARISIRMPSSSQQMQRGSVPSFEREPCGCSGSESMRVTSASHWDQNRASRSRSWSSLRDEVATGRARRPLGRRMRTPRHEVEFGRTVSRR